MLWIAGISAYIMIGMFTSILYALFDPEPSKDDFGIYFFITYLWPVVVPIVVPFIIHQKALRQQEQDKLLKDEGLL